jgi:hypothetical protein
MLLNFYVEQDLFILCLSTNIICEEHGPQVSALFLI